MSKKKTRDEFIRELNFIYGNKYDYSKLEYDGLHKKVCVICPEHGEFWQYPKHLLKGVSCQSCSREKLSEKKRKSKNSFVEQAKIVHGDKYDYSKTEYINNHTDVCIICHEHGEFWQNPSAHLKGHGCPKCFREKIAKQYAKNKEEFILQAKKIHGNKYDYSKVEYINNHTNVCIICPEHGEFWQTPSNHLNGFGCHRCIQSRLERDISLLLKNNGIDYEYNRKYDFLDNLQLDFYIPSLKIAIECQGKQHFVPVDFYGGTEYFERRKFLDNKKIKLCAENGIKLLYYSDLGIEYPYNVIEDKELLIEIIKNKMEH